MKNGERGWTTLAELLHHSYRTFASRTAVTDARGSLTYAELKGRALGIANQLARKGVRPGDRVALIMNNRTEYVQIEHALALGGYARVCAITRLHNSEVAHILSDAQPACLFVEAGWLANAGTDFLAKLPCPVVLVGGRDSADSVTPTNVETFESFVSAAPSMETHRAQSPHDLAWFMYTSGSTGTPKGVMHTNRSVIAMIRNTLQVMHTAGPDDVAIHTAPLSHFSGAIAMSLFAVGGRNVLLDRFQPGELFGAVAEHCATVLPVVPTQLNMLTDYLRQHPRDLSGIRIVPYAGSAIAPERLSAAQAFFGKALVQYYGASEVPMPITALYPEDHTDAMNELGLPRFAAAGRVIDGVEVSIRDNDNKPLAPGEPGEIVVKSPAGSIGYWRNEAATNEILEPDGFVHTGDVGVFDDAGFLFIVDRKKDMIVTGGFNVFPRELENVISRMPEVLEVAVVSAPDEKWGEAIVAVVAPQPGASMSLEQVQAHCRRYLAGYKVPRQLLLMDELPKGSTGKLQKRGLKERFWGARARRVGG